MAAISKEPINKSFIDIICNCSNKNSSAVSSQQTLLGYKGNYYLPFEGVLIMTDKHH